MRWFCWGFLLLLEYITHCDIESNNVFKILGATRSQLRAVKTDSCDGTILVLQQTMRYQSSSWWGEGSTADMHSGEAASCEPAKQHVEELKETYESYQPCTHGKRTFKRSYK